MILPENIDIKYLNNIYSPQDLKNLSNEDMPALADEIRSELVRIVSTTGGHLASNLGVVETTLAIHRVFNTPEDHVIFDVGHQSYVHKMLTGRYANMDTLRQAGGICGFTNRNESDHDCFGAGHSSTSLSAALGFAISDKLNGSNAYTVAVIGDGAYTGGMIHEALNNCRKDLNLIIIMNENEMSISKNIGSFAKNLAKLRTKSGYFKTKRLTGVFLKKIPLIGNWLFRVVRGVKKTVKNVLYGSNYFESMGLTYLGPIDGNDYEKVESLLTEAKKLGESVVVHLKTKKGKGYLPAEEAPDCYHGMSPNSTDSLSKKDNFSLLMGKWITKEAESDKRICAVTAAMCDGTGLSQFREQYPERFYDVGIAEEHALTFAAGLAANGMKPLVAIYSTFLQRGYDSIIHDIALQKLPVVICVDRAGLSVSDGATHHGIFDVSFLSHIPNIRIYTPITQSALFAALSDAMESNAPCAIRYPNGTESQAVIESFYSYDSDKLLKVRNNFGSSNPEVVIITHGKIVTEAVKASDELKKQGISVGIILLEMLKPYDDIAECIATVLPEKAKIIFLEEEIRSGGMGINLSDKLIQSNKIQTDDFKIMAIDDSFISVLSKGQTVYEAAEIDKQSICDTAIQLLR